VISQGKAVALDRWDA